APTGHRHPHPSSPPLRRTPLHSPLLDPPPAHPTPRPHRPLQRVRPPHPRRGGTRHAIPPNRQTQHEGQSAPLPAPIPDHKRQAILADIKAGKARNAIAREHGVSPSTVTNIAKSAGMTDAFDRSQTKRATEAAQADNAAIRAIISRRLLEKANELLDQ